VLLFGNGELDLSELRQSISIGVLELAGGIISMGLGDTMFGLNLTDKLILNSASVAFNFILNPSSSMEFNRSYQVLNAPNLVCFNEGQFVGNALDGISPTFKILGDCLEVSFCKS
ncbi:MAG TPA: hypothetical protein VLA71_18620, partial [Algoriphagus sp.]|nr:hypothetical protein [Algoriphagus sp.]